MANKLQGISVSLPLTVDKTDGPYRLNKTVGDVIRQNFKNLILTSPGERIMVPDFGAGLKRILFEGLGERTNERLVTAIQEQVLEFMPFINLEKVLIRTHDTEASLALNEVRIRIEYNVGSLNINDTLEFTEEITT